MGGNAEAASCPLNGASAIAAIRRKNGMMVVNLTAFDGGPKEFLLETTLIRGLGGGEEIAVLLARFDDGLMVNWVDNDAAMASPQLTEIGGAQERREQRWGMEREITKKITSDTIFCDASLLSK